MKTNVYVSTTWYLSSKENKYSAVGPPYIHCISYVKSDGIVRFDVNKNSPINLNLSFNPNNNRAVYEKKILYKLELSEQQLWNLAIKIESAQKKHGYIPYFLLIEYAFQPRQKKERFVCYSRRLAA